MAVIRITARQHIHNLADIGQQIALAQAVLAAAKTEGQFAGFMNIDVDRFPSFEEAAPFIVHVFGD